MRVYDMLLHLYPASFRREYGLEMHAVFARAPAVAQLKRSPDGDAPHYTGTINST